MKVIIMENFWRHKSGAMKIAALGKKRSSIVRPWKYGVVQLHAKLIRAKRTAASNQVEERLVNHPVCLLAYQPIPVNQASGTYTICRLHYRNENAEHICDFP